MARIPGTTFHDADSPKIEPKTLSMLRDAAYENAKAHGFHDESRTMGDGIALLHTEISEAFEAFREGGGAAEVWYEEKVLAFHKNGSPILSRGKHVSVVVAHERQNDDPERPYKLCGVPSEIADLMIRAFDFAGEHRIDIEKFVLEKMAYNRTRPFKHGNKAL